MFYGLRNALEGLHTISGVSWLHDNGDGAPILHADVKINSGHAVCMRVQDVDGGRVEGRTNACVQLRSVSAHVHVCDVLRQRVMQTQAGRRAGARAA